MHVDAYGRPISPKSRLVMLLILLFIGGFGLHRMYVGKWGTGLLYLVTLGGFGLWTIYDAVLIILGSFRDKQGLLIKSW